MIKTASLISPYGDRLIDLLTSSEARRGEIKDFTGIDAPYEEPQHPEVTLDTVDQTAEHNARAILEYLTQEGFVRSN